LLVILFLELLLSLFFLLPLHPYIIFKNGETQVKYDIGQLKKLEVKAL